MKVLKGAEVSAKLKEQIKEELKNWEGRLPRLGIVRVGEKPDDLSYERGATKTIQSLGMEVQVFSYPQDISKEAFQKEFLAVNQNPEIDGILVLRPLPPHIGDAWVESAIDPNKDLDGISPVNAAKIFAGDDSGYAPCTPEAVMEMLAANDIDPRGQRAVIIGRSMVVGRPLAMLLLKANATVTICHTKTRDLPGVCREAQILVAAAGKAKMVDESYVGSDAVVMDVGINVDENGKLCGDVDFESASQKAGALTPVPGGVGAVTTAVLARHLLDAAKKRN